MSGTTGRSSGRPRTAEELHGQWRTHGGVVLEAVNAPAYLVSNIFFGLSVAPGVTGLTLLTLAIAVDAMVLGIIAGALVALSLTLVAFGARQRRACHRRPAPVWTVDRRGVTIDGVGPVPWGELEPPRWRLEFAPTHGGLQWVRALPLTPPGRRRALDLHPQARAVLNVAATPVGSRTPLLHSVRIPVMKGASRREFVTFLAHAHAEMRNP